MAFDQKNRLLNLHTPLGDNKLVLTEVEGHEELSRLFSFRLDMVSEESSIKPGDIVGKPVSFNIKRPDGSRRPFHGYVRRFMAGDESHGHRVYRAEIVPQLWFLTRKANCRIFQKKTVKQILEQVFADAGLTDYETSEIKGEHKQWEYCVQYRETDFNFVSRLMEQEGIFYYFRHEKDKHILVLGDQKGAYRDCPEKEVDLPADYSGIAVKEHLTSWEHRYEFRSGKWAQTDYNFETPSTSLLTQTQTNVTLADAKKFELFDYPGEYAQKSDGEAEVKLRMEEEEVGYDVVHGGSGCPTFTPGHKFTVKSHPAAAEKNKSYVITSIQHSIREPMAYASGDRDVDSTYANTFTCIPDSVQFRPARITPKPVVNGIQTAVVVGPAGEEIYVDKYGRVKVQFFWDREGKKDDNSTCWIRVAQNWAGEKWGMLFHPRIGQEVVVDFLEGDPDRPLIIGSVYNAEQMPPYDLPGDKTQSGVKSRSTKQGAAANFNELRFEDKKGEEHIYFHAEKDFERIVENNDTLKVGFDKKDDGNQKIEIFNNQDVKVGTAQSADGSQTLQVWKDQTTTLKTGDRAVTIEMGNDTLNIKMGNQTTKLDLGKSSTEALQSIELKVGQSSVKVDQMGVTIKGLMLKIEGTMMTQVKGMMTQVNGDAMLTVKGGLTMIN
ncbi:MAG: type VI secretion system tip protein VgrG [Pirellulaceae bacterium]|jgi:type VI secretion system secreted protein VgrG|nr:type VI secretion system tip protein VgrG [Pirellulaceae bacterium]